jgi:hypothetical protein
MKLQHHAEKLLLMIILSFPSVSFGQSGNGDGMISNPLEGKNDGNLLQFINGIIDAAIKLGAVLAVIAMIYAGFLFVTAQGDEGKIETAKKVLLYTVIGIAILLGARALSEIVANTVTSVGDATK